MSRVDSAQSCAFRTRQLEYLGGVSNLTSSSAKEAYFALERSRIGRVGSGPGLQRTSILICSSVAVATVPNAFQFFLSFRFWFRLSHFLFATATPARSHRQSSFTQAT